ncbi:hypothetical protein JCM5350_001227 [Sporobolomyces pararoseus]
MSSSPLLPPSSSPSSPFPLPPFSRLPNELVQFIIESTVPRYYHSASYATRQSTLSSLSLVSKRFHQITKPLLFAIVKRKPLELNGPWIDSSPKTSRSLVRELIWPRHVKSEEFGQILRSYSQLRKLTLSGDYRTVDMSLLSQTNNLAYLQLHRVAVSSSSSFQFETVTAFEFYDVLWVNPSSEIINSTTFPALSALSFAFQSELSIKYVSQSVGPQLDAFFTDWRGFSEDQIGQLQDKTLFDVYLPSLTYLPCGKYLRIIYGGFDKPSQALGNLLDLLRQSSPVIKPSLIYLPSSINFNRSSYNGVVAKLNSECEKAGVEFVFEEQPEDWSMDSAISYDFWRRMKMRRAEKETE